jgi:hypothetical protein
LALRQYLASPLYRGGEPTILLPGARMDIDAERKADVDA